MRTIAGCVGVAMFVAGVVLTQHPVVEVGMIGLGLALCGLTFAFSAIFPEQPMKAWTLVLAVIVCVAITVTLVVRENDQSHICYHPKGAYETTVCQ